MAHLNKFKACGHECKMNIRILYTLAKALIFVSLIPIMSSCNDGKSYAELLEDEDNAVNWYLAQNRVITTIPEDSVFIEGKDAPFYKMNGDGTVYMRVINKGDMNNRPQIGETVYFRFMRYDIEALQRGESLVGVGNSENMGSGSSSLSLIYGNNVLSSTTQYGSGIQVPLKFLGYNCEVELIVKSTDGFTQEIGNGVPFLYKNLKYFKAEY